MLTFFALEQESRVLCYANANLTRAEQPGEVMRFVEFWHGLAGAPPQWLYFDSKVTTYPELSQLNQQGVWFATIRRRGSAVVRRLRRLPASAWRKAVIDTPKRFHQDIRYVDERVQSAAATPARCARWRSTASGKEQPTLLLTNNLEETARNLVIRYAGRNRVEDGLGSAVNFFHLNCLSSEVRLNVDVDAAMTVLANGCYRWLAQPVEGLGAESAEGPVPEVRGDGGPGGGAGGSGGGAPGPAESQPDPARGVSGPGRDTGPVAGQPPGPVHLRLTIECEVFRPCGNRR